MRFPLPPDIPRDNYFSKYGKEVIFRYNGPLSHSVHVKQANGSWECIGRHLSSDTDCAWALHKWAREQGLISDTEPI